MPTPYERIRILNANDPSALPIPSTADLDRFETDSKIRLPLSYREFCLFFGAGELGGYYRIASPMPVADMDELSRLNAVVHGLPDDHLLRDYGTREFTDKFLFFATTGGGDGYAWLTTEVTDPRNHEYAIYCKDRDFPPLRRVASSFSEFIDDVCLAPKKQPGDEAWIPEPTYYRFCK